MAAPRSNNLARAILAKLKPGSVVACQITSVTPLLVTLSGTASVPGLKLAGLTYATSAQNNALAWITSTSAPIILPIGT